MLIYRIDDLGMDYEKYIKLKRLFEANKVKHCVGAIPGLIDSYDDMKNSYFTEYWVHGNTHTNRGGSRKSEYTESRDYDTVSDELLKSFEKCKKLFGSKFIPGFIPPWNQFHEKFLSSLTKAGFKFYSSDKELSTKMPQLHINIDLHTNKKKKYTKLEEMKRDCEKMIEKEGYAYLMLHHTKMDDCDYDLLDSFFKDREIKNIINIFPSEYLN